MKGMEPPTPVSTARAPGIRHRALRLGHGPARRVHQERVAQVDVVDLDVGAERGVVAQVGARGPCSASDAA